MLGKAIKAKAPQLQAADLSGDHSARRAGPL
jgi:hypothetical protein